MSYRYPWAHTFETYELKFRKYIGMNASEVCPDHEKCFRAKGLYPATQGEWSLIDPLLVSFEMPGGVNKKLLTASVEGLRQGGGWGTAFHTALRLYADAAKILERDLQHGSDWQLNKFTLNRSIDGVTNIDVNLYQWAEIFLPGASVIIHDAVIKLDGEYYTDVKPPTATVRITVTNSETGALVKNAYVALMSGARIVADGYTDGGEVTFENIDEGSYTVKVLAGGYHAFEQSIEVEPPSVWYEIKIVPIPTIPIPSWVWYAVAGIGGLGAITIVPSIIKRKAKPPIIVVK